MYTVLDIYLKSMKKSYVVMGQSMLTKHHLDLGVHYGLIGKPAVR